jgi:hypothetical protein
MQKCTLPIRPIFCLLLMTNYAKALINENCINNRFATHKSKIEGNIKLSLKSLNVFYRKTSTNIKDQYYKWRNSSRLSSSLPKYLKAWWWGKLKAYQLEISESTDVFLRRRISKRVWRNAGKCAIENGANQKSIMRDN